MIRIWILAAALMLIAATAAHGGDALKQAVREGRLGPATESAFAKRPEPQRVFVAFDPGDEARKAGVSSADLAAALAKRAGPGSRLLRSFERIEGFALETDAAGLAALLADPRVLRIDLDSGGSGAMEQARPLVGAEALFGAGIDGRGRTVAVLDSGHSAAHPAFAGRVRAEYCYCSGDNCCPNGTATQAGPGAATDDHGHGSNVSGIVLGSGEGALRGIAPAADLVSIKVLDRNNRFCCASDVLAGIERVLLDHPEVDAINMSLNSDAVFGSICDFAESWTQAALPVLRALEERGTLLVAASGNRGNRSALPMPACLSQVLSVGAVWDADLGTQTFSIAGQSCSESTAPGQLTCFSNTSHMLDLVAPGARISSAGRFGGLSTFLGTSQATPMVSGCVALLRQARPQASAAEIRQALLASPTRVPEPGTQRSHPLLDCSHALGALGVSTGAIDERQVGSQYWLTGAGTLQGLRLDLEFSATTDTAFGDDFDPAELQRYRWGQARIEFTGCDSAQFSWDSVGPDSAGFGRAGYPLQRIAPSRRSQDCEARGLQAMEHPDWVAGTWYGGPTRDGEGLFIDVLANGVVLVAFFTHRPAAQD